MKHRLFIALLIISSCASIAQTKMIIGRQDGTNDTIAVNAISQARFSNSNTPMIQLAQGIDYEREKVWSVAADSHGNLFVSLTQIVGSSDYKMGVFKITSSGVRTQISTSVVEMSWPAMKVAPGDTVVAVRGQKALFYFNPNTVTTAMPYATAGLGGITDFDFDQQKLVWAGGTTNTSLYRINRAKQSKAFPFSGVVQAVRVYNNAVYVAAAVVVGTDTSEAVYQLPINADSTLGAPVKYFDLKAQAGYAGRKITAITFDADGKLYVGIDAAPGILVVSGANAAPKPLYGGLIGSGVLTFQWGTGSILYVVRQNAATPRTPQVLLTVDMQTQSAPYYGRE
jgi:hypothetical protein